MKISIDQIKKLRKETQSAVADCRNALEKAHGNFNKAKEILKSLGLDKAAKKKDRAVLAGLVDTYIHAGGRICSII